jgi:chromosome partitioning protein
MIITVTNQKGGVGKTTFSINLVLMLLKTGHKTLLVDSDPQGSAISFRELRGDSPELPQFPAIANTSKTLDRDILPIAKSFDFVVIDSGGRDSLVFRSSLMVADVVVVPIVPGTLELWGSDKTFDIIDEAAQFNKKVKVFGLMNMVKHNTRIEKDFASLIEALEEKHKLKFLKNCIYDRIAFKYSIAQGKAVFELSGQDRDIKAIEEITLIFDELVKEIL